MRDKNNTPHPQKDKQENVSRKEGSGYTPDTGGSPTRSDSTGLNEKSSTMGRGERRSGLSTKDGVTGSDLDGQVTD